MPDLHLREVDELIVRRLRERAKAKGRPAAEEHRRILREALLGPKKPNIHELAAQLRADIAASGQAQTPAEEILRQERARR
jgi:antitoxin FitA